MRQALALVGPSGCLTLLAVSGSVGSGRYRGASIDPARVGKVLDTAAHIAYEAGVRCMRLADPGELPARAIVEHTEGHDLLAMGAPTMSWLGGLFVGGVAVSALRASPIPLLLARPAPTEVPFGRRVLVASDAGEGSDRLVELASAIALKLGGGVMLVHAAGVESESRPHRIERQIHMLEATLAEACEVHVEAAPAHEAVVRIAASGRASLIVMGSRRLEGLRGIGSVSERVVHHAPCSVLVVPPERLAA